MKINLNKLPYVNKPIISREVILKNITEWDIFKKYINNDIKLKEPFSSPFRKDNTPSFALFRNSTGDILYNDFVLGGGDAFQFVKYYFGYNSWFDVYSRIAVDFWLDNIYHCKNSIKNEYKKYKPETGAKPVKINDKVKIGVTVRPWKDYDIKYWNSFGIDHITLLKYNVFPVDYIIFKSNSKEKTVKADKYSYAYYEFKDGEATFKIYQPFSKYKWFSDVNTSIWQGWRELPVSDEILIWTKSLKDVMSINETCRLASVSLQNEKIKPKINVVNELKRRFETIFILYDNDFDKESNYGQIFASELCDEFNIINIKIPDKYKTKDFSDLVKNFGKEKAKKILTDLISEKLKKLKINDNLPY